MRKLFTFNMVTLDGFFEGPNGRDRLAQRR